MANLLEVSRRKLSDIQRFFIVTGIIMLILAVLIVWTDALLKLLVGLVILLISYSLFYVAYKVHAIRKILD
ncbi:MAG: hypothetical protein NTY12_04340 [Candidatus Falkowbacteria bacterium]|nr:hypothetical protein [Candidatus Falkowbacteria bacterium]